MSPGTPAADRGATRAAAATDRELLTRYVRRRDEPAFTELVRRYGGMVLGVCRRVLSDRHSAEDAFQATFLVLARDAARVRRRGAVAAWLHGVAYRSALRELERQRQRRETQVEVQDVSTPPLEEIGALYPQQLVDEELQRLPDALREPLVLHYLQGLTSREVAERLGARVTTIEGRLKRGKLELRRRLIRRGVGLGAVAVAMQTASSGTASAVSEPLVTATAKAALAHAAGHTTTVIISQEAAYLAGKELAMFAAPKLATVLSLSAAALIGAGLMVGGVATPGGARAGGAASAAALPLLDVDESSGAATAIEVQPLAAAALVQVDTAAAVSAGEPQRAGVDAGDAASTDATARPAASLDAEIEQLKARLEAAEDERAVLKASLERLTRQLDRRVAEDGSEAPPARGAAGDASLPQSAARPTLDYARPDATSERIHRALQSPTMLEFVETPLQDVVEWIGEVHGIQVLLHPSLADAGINADALVTLILKENELANALDILLERLGGGSNALDYVIENQVLKIMTREEAEGHEETHVYETRHLSQFEQDEVVEAIQHGTSGPWEDIDGAGGTITEVKGGLIIRHTQRGHRQVVDLLEQLARHGETGPAGTAGRGEAAASPAPNGAALRGVPLDYETRDAGQSKSEAALSARTMPLSFDNVPLSEVLDQLGRFHDVPIRIHRSVEDEGFMPGQEQVTLSLPGERTLERALDEVLAEAGDRIGAPLDYVIEHGAIMIMTQSTAEAIMRVRIYTIPTYPMIDSPDILVKLIQNCTSGPWYDTDGVGGQITLLNGTMVVVQTQRGHQEISHLFQRLDQFAATGDAVLDIDVAATAPRRSPRDSGGGVPGRPAPAETAERRAIFESSSPPSATGSSPVNDAAASGRVADTVTLRGRITVHGDIPAAAVLNVPRVVDGKTTFLRVADPSLIVGQEGGLKNAFVYLQQSGFVGEIPPPRKEPLVLASRDSQFEPRALIVRTGQVLSLKNFDDEATNFHIAPLQNAGMNHLVSAGNTQGVSVFFSRQESLPIRVTDDIRAWKSPAWVLPLVHPWGDVTDEQGRFEIALPDGEYPLAVWHERAGYLADELLVTVTRGEVVDLNLTYDGTQFAREASDLSAGGAEAP